MTARNSTMTAAWAATAASSCSSATRSRPPAGRASRPLAHPPQVDEQRHDSVGLDAALDALGLRTDRAGGSTGCRVTPLASWSVRDLELDARLRHRSIRWPVRGAEAGLCSLSQGPDAEALTTVDVFTVQIVILRPRERQPKCIHVQPSADARVRGNHRDARDKLHIHDVTFRH